MPAVISSVEDSIDEGDIADDIANIIDPNDPNLADEIDNFLPGRWLQADGDDLIFKTELAPMFWYWLTMMQAAVMALMALIAVVLKINAPAGAEKYDLPK